MTESQTVTVLGAGALGAVLARAFAAAGHRTTVWNRTPGRVDALRTETPSLLAAGSVPEAVAAGDLAASPSPTPGPPGPCSTRPVTC